ncbi:N-6 DNA methylase [Natrinema salsiterrestre]|uniref:N-6 DNA methylase n=1 Tax=Natrinema salsiterrestre TaxID=2950540 RepID=A0A9Q4Q474_9EURY|nr:N-6 DNA methylase [Natrinema salsiterrestre]MDF9748306.1 N-6 DNA methylase [Natrinema salsiterrestre]
MPKKEAAFHGLLYTRLLDHIDENDTLFDEPVTEKSTESGFADIYIPSALNGEIVIEVKRDDIYPREKDVVKQARGYADDLGAEFYATCNSNDFFLFHDQGEIEMADVDFYYFNLREADISEAIPQLLGVVEHVHEEASLPDQSERDRLVGILRSFHSSIWPSYAALAEKKYGRNERFTQEFETWVQENDYGSLDDDEQFEVAGKQFAYLLTNKVLFYEVVREKTKAKYDPEVGDTVREIETESGFELNSLHEHTTLSNLERHLQNQFETIVEEIDYEPIFDSGASLFAGFPQNKKTLRNLQDFISNIEAESIVELDEDLLGEIYEELIPIEERKALGQFYTHPKIAQTISEWAIQENGEEQPRVLDPASGSGTFTVEAYKRLNHLAPNASHQEIVDRLVAVDINRFPLHLTALNLASQNISEKTDRLHLFHDSFFNIDPETQYLESSRIDDEEQDVLGTFDAVIGNPPYIDQGSLYPNKEHFRNHLKRFGDGRASPFYNGDMRLSKRSDAYVYFVTHGTNFLDEGGRLAFIIPTKWMMTGYGEDFQGFVYDQYKLEAVVGFSARAFEDAFVDSALILLEKCSDEEERRENVAEFIQIKDSMEVEDILDTVEYPIDLSHEAEMLVRNRETYRTVAVQQGEIMDRDTKKIRHYLTAPQTFIKLLENPTMVNLEELLSNAERGLTSGANKFFYIDKEEIDERGIDSQFVTPMVKWIKQMEKGDPLTEDTTELYVLDMHDYVEKVRSKGGLEQSDVEQRVKDSLESDGHRPVLDYIREGEAQGINERRTCASRSVWFDLGEIDRPDIIHPKGFKYRVFASRNDGMVANDRLYCLNVKSEVDKWALLGYLNSTVYQAVVETWGRNEGRGMLEIMKYEVMSVPALDVRELSEDMRAEIADAYRAFEADEEGAQTRLDEAVLEAAQIDVPVDEFQELTEAVTNRRNEKGMSSEVLVEQVDTLEEYGTHTFTIGSEGNESDTDLSQFM